jgi:UDP-2-acetamido-3-amino-2,3-dideoxy-glucuronate N-acetyltransferase
MDYTVHPLSDVQSTQIGSQTQIWQFVIILKEAVIGSNCNINCFCFIENDVIIGDHVTIKSGVQVWDGLRIEDYVFVGPNVSFTNDLLPRSKVYPQEFGRTVVRRGASIGANATIITGIEIGECSMIGAGSVVTKNIPAYSVWYGNPATHQGYITEEGTLLNLSLWDNKKKVQYVLNGHKPELPSG